MLLSEVALGEIHELTKAKVSPYYFFFISYATNHLVLILKLYAQLEILLTFIYDSVSMSTIL